MSSVRKVTGRRGSAGQARRATPDGHHPAIQGASRCLHPAPAPGADPRQIEVSGNLPAGSPGRAARWLAVYRVPGTRDRKTDGKPERSCREAPVRMHKWFSLRRGREHSPPRRCCSGQCSRPPCGNPAPLGSARPLRGQMPARCCPRPHPRLLMPRSAPWMGQDEPRAARAHGRRRCRGRACSCLFTCFRGAVRKTTAREVPAGALPSRVL